MRSKEFFRRSKVSKLSKALFATFDLLKKLLATSTIRRLRVYKRYLDFQSPEQFSRHNFDHEIESINIYKVAPVANF